jgi:threonyl-tRNA synthetase
LNEIIAYEVDGNIIDTQSCTNTQNATPIYFDNSEKALEVIRHSTAHLMAQAIKELYPEARFFVGPVVQEGFYYDFRVDKPISDKELKDIEKRMKKLINKEYPITKYSITKDEAIKKFENDDLKKEVLKKIDSTDVSIYAQGDFEDLCRGPHVPNISYLKHFKLTKVSGAYLGGVEGNEMLTRVYGISFADKESLDKHLHMIEEAKKRDHRKLGSELELFMFDEQSGAGLPFWMPKGARLRSKLEQILFVAHRKKGYQPVRGPEILNSAMWQKSGHYACYGENMYLTKIDEQEYGIKPMNCIGHIKIYKHGVHSYRDLPMKFFEYGVVHRHEKSGVLHGLLRVREFTQDDAHIFCAPSQIKSSVLEVVDFVDRVMKKFDFNYTMEISTKPEKAIGDDAIWDIATQGLKDALDENNLPYGIDEGGGAFYGPKIDIKIEDALGRKWQCGTIQVDFNLPERFELDFVDEDGESKRPVMIHRAILGSFERFIAILTEHYGGEFPFFIAPTQVIFVPIGENHKAYAYELCDKLIDLGIDGEVYDRNDSFNKRIRNAEKQRVPMVAIIGDNEVENKTLAIRDRRQKQKYDISESEFLKIVKEKLDEGRL